MSEMRLKMATRQMKWRRMQACSGTPVREKAASVIHGLPENGEYRE